MFSMREQNGTSARAVLVATKPRRRIRSGAWPAMPGFRPEALFMPCSIAMAWSNGRAERAAGPPERICRRALSPTIYGVPTSRVSSGLADRRYCYPLAISDFASRFLPAAIALP